MMKRALILLAGTALLPAHAYAQTTATSGETNEAADVGQSNDIIVTAQRYEQRLQDVPLSISVIGSKELAARAVTNLTDLQYSVPGLSLYEYGVGRQYIQLRGVSNTTGSSTIGIYLDETPLGLDQQGDAISLRLLDLERVEVLRGPQATLYGQGSMGGAIRYIPAAPRLDAYSGSFDGEISSTKGGDEGYKAIGVINLPISTDKLGLRVVAGFERTGGYIDNSFSGAKDVNSTDIYTVRGSLLAKPSEKLTLSLLGLYQQSNQHNFDFGVNDKTTVRTNSPTRDRYGLLQAKASYDLDFAELSASGSYLDRHTTSDYDLSGYYVPALIAALKLPVGYINQVTRLSTTDYTMYNGELRLASQGTGPFGWQLGATYRDLETDTVAATPVGPGTLPFVLIAADQRLHTKAYAAYGELTYALTPQLTAIAGIRYFSEHRNQATVSTNFGVTKRDINQGIFNTVNPRFNLSYAFTPDSMLFVNVAKGFRAGGFNLTSAGALVPPSYKPDSLWSYEVGTKHQLFDNRLVLDASLYRTIWNDVQSYIIQPGSALIVVNNSGRVTGWGVDLAATARPTRDLTLSATYAWNDLAFARAGIDKAVGDPVDAAVRESWSAALDYRPALTETVNGIFRIDYQHAGKSQITLRGFQIPAVIPRPGRDLVNARIGAALGKLELTLFANNLFNERAPIIVGPFGVFSENLEQRPRVIGISASTRF